MVLLLFLILLNVNLFGKTEVLRDPFSFASGSVQISKDIIPEKVVYRNNERCVEVGHKANKKTVAVGDRIGEWNVKHILDETLVLQNQEGAIREISFSHTENNEEKTVKNKPFNLEKLKG